MQDWLVRTCEIIDRYHPRLIYFDWWIQHSACKPWLKKLAAYYYNRAQNGELRSQSITSMTPTYSAQPCRMWNGDNLLTLSLFLADRYGHSLKIPGAYTENKPVQPRIGDPLRIWWTLSVKTDAFCLT